MYGAREQLHLQAQTISQSQDRDRRKTDRDAQAIYRDLRSATIDREREPEEEIMRLRRELADAQQNHRLPTNHGARWNARSSSMFVGSGGMVKTPPTIPAGSKPHGCSFGMEQPTNPTSALITTASAYLPPPGNRRFEPLGFPALTGKGSILAATIVGPFPTPTPKAYTQRKRAIELWSSAQNGTRFRQLVAEIIPVFPVPAKGTGLDYMGKPKLCRIRDLSRPYLTLSMRDTEKPIQEIPVLDGHVRGVRESFCGAYKEFRYRLSVVPHGWRRCN